MRFFANCRELPERAFRKKCNFFTNFALVKYRVISCDNRIKTQNIV